MFRAMFTLLLLLNRARAQYIPVSRWGQAAALVEDTLFVHGGRTDQFNEYSYTAAPVNNDVLSLSLSSPFNLSSPPWKHFGGCSNCSLSQGPAVAWHTLTPFNTSALLLFGGTPGPNSPIVMPVRADSGALLDIQNSTEPIWYLEPASWDNEPVRRIYHSGSSSGGKVWVIGGEKADGSGAAFSEHFVFDSSASSFTQLPAAGGPPDILGHASIVLSNGSLLVLGGYTPSQQSLIPFDRIWVLDTTQSTFSWSTLSISSSALPPPRRGFAATLLDGGKVLIHGGADAVLQNSFSDGWILDTTQSPMVWSSVDVLSQLGPRRDHFAVGVGSLAIVGFGYANNGGASPALQVFDASKNALLSTYTPPSAITSPTATTLPGSTHTPNPNNPSGSNMPTGTGSYGSAHPSSSDSHGSNGGGNQPEGSASRSQSTTKIALGTVFGVVGLMIGAFMVTWYVRHKVGLSREERFTLLSEGDGDEEGGSRGVPILPVAGVEKTMGAGVMRTLGLGRREQRLGLQRRDILADEDTREFGRDEGRLRRDASYGSGQSSWISSLVTLGTFAKGTKRVPSASSSLWREKADDPFADDMGFLGPKRTRQESSSETYVDPFADYEVDPLGLGLEAFEGNPALLTLTDPPPRSYIKPTLLLRTGAQVVPDFTRLTPVSEQPSLSTTTVSNSSNPSLTPSTCNQHLSPVTPLPSSVSSRRQIPSFIDANPAPTSTEASFIHRSNSWWSRFAKAPLLDRRSSDRSSTRTSQLMLDIRDPNPPPRLVPIEEVARSERSRSGDKDEGIRQGEDEDEDHLYSTQQHGRSRSSLQTTNTEKIEQMGRTMDIVLKGSASIASTTSSSRSARSRSGSRDGEGVLVTSPQDMTTLDGRSSPFVNRPPPFRPSLTSKSSSSPPPSSFTRPTFTGGTVATRILAYERRMSQQEEQEASPKSPPLSRARGNSLYGLVPKPSLFVANPDHGSRERST